jgi:hypothetical protein
VAQVFPNAWFISSRLCVFSSTTDTVLAVTLITLRRDFRFILWKAGDYQETPYKPRTNFFSKPGSMFKVLFRWRSSIWRATFTELAIYLTLYTMLSLTYRFVLTEPRRRDFERFSLFVTWHLKNILIIPLGLVLGFYVSSVSKQ